MRKLTPEHKKKISDGRKKFLNANPDKVPYILAHSSRKSWPEVFFEQLLNENNITGWVYNYPFKRYRLDFAFPEIFVDVEIDGSTHHLLDTVKRIDSERDALLSEAGWKIFRIDANLLYDKSQHDRIIQSLNAFVKDARIFGQLKAPVKIKPKPRPKGQALVDYHSKLNAQNIENVLSSDIDFTKQGWVKDISNVVGISPNKGGKWLKRYIPDLYEKAWKRKPGP